MMPHRPMDSTVDTRAVVPPLSVELAALLSGDGAESLTLNHLLSRTSGRGPFGLIILLSLPFMVPISLPGVSNLFGAVIVYLAWRLGCGHPPRLPRALGDRKVSGGLFARVLRAGVRLLAWVERLVRPRKPAWIQSRTGRVLGAAALALGGLMLALPLPPTILFSNFVPAIGVLLVAASMMEEDGLVIWLGYLATIASAIYLTMMIGLHFEILLRLIRTSTQWWNS